MYYINLCSQSHVNQSIFIHLYNIHPLISDDFFPKDLIKTFRSNQLQISKFFFFSENKIYWEWFEIVVKDIHESGKSNNFIYTHYTRFYQSEYKCWVKWKTGKSHFRRKKSGINWITRRNSLQVILLCALSTYKMMNNTEM